MKKTVSAALVGALMLSCGATLLSAGNTDPAVKYTVSAEKAAPGETFDVIVSFSGIKNAVGYAIMPDDSSLEQSGVSFVGFSEIGKNQAVLFAPDPMDANDVAAAYLSATALDGDYVKYTFSVPADAKVGTVISIAFEASVLDANNKEISGAEKTVVSVAVEKDAPSTAVKTGDIDGNGTVDISDAIVLFRYSMMPDLYPITYEGNIDYNKDRVVDISDAIMLFRYSMMPDLYPIE